MNSVEEGCVEAKYPEAPYHSDESCGFCMEPARRARCVPINYVEKVCAIVPQNFYVPSPYKLNDGTTYRTCFVPKPYMKTESFKPSAKYKRGGGIVEGPTEYKYAYLPYDVAPYRKPEWANKAEYKGTEGTVNGISTYRASYQPQCATPAKMCRPNPYKDPNPGSMDDLTTYRMQFTPHYQEKVCAFKPQTYYSYSALAVPPFKGNTMYRTSYLPPCHALKTKSLKQKDCYQPLDYGFEEDTTYTEAYRPFAFQHCAPVSKSNCYIFKDLKL